MIQTVTRSIVPALPGYFAVYGWTTDGKRDVWISSPIIAWEIETTITRDQGEERVHHFSTPITIDGDFCDTQPHGVLLPDGRVEVPCDCIYKDLEDFKANGAEWSYHERRQGN